MSVRGQTEKSSQATGKSALPSITDFIRGYRHVSKVPQTDSCTAANDRSLDHVVSPDEQCRWHDDAERLCGLQIDDQFELGRLFDRQVGRLCTLEYLIDENGAPTILIRIIRAVAQKEARLRIRSLDRSGWQPIPQSHIGNLATIVAQHKITLHDERLRALPHHCRKRLFKCV